MPTFGKSCQGLDASVTSNHGPRTIFNHPYDFTRTGPVRESSMFFICYGTCTGGPVRDPQRCRTAPLRARKGIDTTRIGKNPARASYFAVRGPYGPRTGCSKSLNPYGARKLIMHALKLGKAKSVRRRTGPVSGRTIFVQNSLWTARTGPRSVMWLRHYYTASKTKARLDPQTNFPRWRAPDLHADTGREAHQRICQFLIAETCSIFLNQVC